MAGCVFAVSFSSSSEPWKHRLEMEKPSASSASSKAAFATAYFSASSLPIPEYWEACPGNTNATLPMTNSSLTRSRKNRGGGELLFDFLVDAGARKSRGHADGIFDGVCIGAPVANDANTAHTQERRATILRVIDRLLQPFKCPLGK